jgi:hypothetical protein
VGYERFRISNELALRIPGKNECPVYTSLPTGFQTRLSLRILGEKLVSLDRALFSGFQLRSGFLAPNLNFELQKVRSEKFKNQ